MASKVQVGGWCPRGRRAEDGQIPGIYPLRETTSDGYEERTRLNVRDSDATLLIWRGTMTPGTALTARLADAVGKPILLLRLDGRGAPPDPVVWVASRVSGYNILNVAGPRESSRPGIYAVVRSLMEGVLRELVETEASMRTRGPLGGMVRPKRRATGAKDDRSTARSSTGEGGGKG